MGPTFRLSCWMGSPFLGSITTRGRDESEDPPGPVSIVVLYGRLKVEFPESFYSGHQTPSVGSEKSPLSTKPLCFREVKEGRRNITIRGLERIMTRFNV